MNPSTNSTASYDLPIEGMTCASCVGRVEKAGYALTTATITLDIEGMTCASCVGRVEKALKAVNFMDKFISLS